MMTTVGVAANTTVTNIKNRPLLLVVVGPTAIGKTAAAIHLAQHHKLEILSADSRQFYHKTTIGTAHPTAEELAAVKHHFIDFLDVTTPYSSGDFERDAIAFLEEHFHSHDAAVMTGGSGLYVNAVLHGFDSLPSNPSIREALMSEMAERGIEVLQEELKEKDPGHYATMDIHNHQRLIRALEVCRASGLPYSQLRKSTKKDRPFRYAIAGITCERSELYERINHRVDKMVADGLVEEARQLYPHRDENALNTVGYKELFEHFDGKISLEESIALIKQHTRNFAKRQMTWFNKQNEITWFNRHDREGLLEWSTTQLNANE